MSLLLASLGVVILPKCPLCIAAYATSLWTSAGTVALIFSATVGWFVALGTVVFGAP